MQSPIPAARAADAAQISDAVERFLAQGKAIEELPIMRGTELDNWRAFTLAKAAPAKPADDPAAQKKAKAALKRAAPRNSGAVKFSRDAANERRSLAPKVRRLAKAGTTTMEIMRILGVTRRIVVKVADEYGIQLNKKEGSPGSLTAEIVIAARREHARGGISIAKIAAKHDVKSPTMRDAIRGTTWADIS